MSFGKSKRTLAAMLCGSLDVASLLEDEPLMTEVHCFFGGCELGFPFKSE